MKKFLTLILITLSCSVTFALDNGQSVLITLYTSSDTSNHDRMPDENRNVRHRMPSRPILCSISVEDGVSFDDGANPDIISYEIKDTNNNPVAVTGDEADFILTLSSLTGEYVIQFRTDECVYYGSICI